MLFQLISRWIGKESWDGFIPKKFHTICDDKFNTVALLKRKEQKKLNNRLIWKSTNEWGQTKDSLQFLLKIMMAFLRMQF